MRGRVAIVAGDPSGRTQHWASVVAIARAVSGGLLPTLVDPPGYFVAAFILGVVFLGYGIHMALRRTAEAARRLVYASLVYLPLIYLLMVVDKVPKL
jgi:protoheme IX farnesyltransferase